MKEKCRETLEIAVQILDGETVPTARKDEIEAHLHECAPCFERLGMEREVKNLISRLRGSSPCPDHLRSKVTALFEGPETNQ